MHVGQIGQLAVSAVDGDLHHRLLDPSNYSADLYKSALEPLVRFHSANADLFYVYTMAVRDGVPRFILDTAASSDLRTQHRRWHLREVVPRRARARLGQGERIDRHASHDGTDTDFSRMYRDADKALYEAGAEGNGYSVVFTTSPASKIPAPGAPALT